ncbi:MAG: hypothetical protein AAF961_03330, partial [Planctomycetota bacterium]
MADRAIASVRLAASRDIWCKQFNSHFGCRSVGRWPQPLLARGVSCSGSPSGLLINAVVALINLAKLG